MCVYDIGGLAGCIKPVIKKPTLWHLMTSRENLRGSVAHPVKPVTKSGTDEYVITNTSFGYTPCRVAIIDGLFMAVNLKKILKAGWKFNENFDFHHYDIARCLDANRLRLKIGVAPIHGIHDSPGLLDAKDISWTKSQEKLLKLYGTTNSSD